VSLAGEILIFSARTFLSSAVKTGSNGLASNSAAVSCIHISPVSSGAWGSLFL